MMSVGWSLRRGRGLFVLLVLGLLVGWVVGCTQFSALKPSDDEISTYSTTSAIEDVAFDLKPSAEGVTSCGLSALTGNDRQVAIQEALNNSKVQALRQELSNRGFTVNDNATLTFRLNGEKLVWLPAGATAGIMYETYLGTGYAVGVIQDKDKTINIRPDHQVHHIAGFDPKTRTKLLRQVRSSKQVKVLEKTLKGQNQRIDWNQSVLFVDTEGGSATVGVAVKETDSAKPAWFGYRVQATINGRKVTVQSVQAEECAGATASATDERGHKVVPAIPACEDGDCSRIPIIQWVRDEICAGGNGPTGCIELKASGDISGYIQVKPSTLDFSTRLVGKTKDLTLTVTSSLNASIPLSLTMFYDSSRCLDPIDGCTTNQSLPYSVTPSSFNLAPSQSQIVTVHFAPTAKGSFPAHLNLSNNGVDIGASIAVAGHAVTWQDYCQAQAITYNQQVQLGNRPMLLLDSELTTPPNSTSPINRSPSDKTAILQGFKDLSCDEIKALIELVLNRDASTPNPDRISPPNVDPVQFKTLLQQLINEYNSTKNDPTLDATTRAARLLTRLQGIMLAAFGSNTSFQAVEAALENFLFSKGGGSLAGDAFWAILQSLAIDKTLDFLKIESSFLGAFLDWLVGKIKDEVTGGNHHDEIIGHFNKTTAFIAVFIGVAVEFSPNLTSFMDHLTHSGLTAEGIGGTVFAFLKMSKDLAKDKATFETMMPLFLNHLDVALDAHTRGVSWARYTPDFLAALINPYLNGCPASSGCADGASNMASAFVTYVTLAVHGPSYGQSGWIILTTPAATAWGTSNITGGYSTAYGYTGFAHVLAGLTDTNGNIIAVGVFHVETLLAVKDVNNIITNAELVAKNIYRFLGPAQGQTTQPITDPSIAFIAIIAYSIEGTAASQLQTGLQNAYNAGLLDGVPVYVVYIDANGIVRGYCVGGDRCSTDILNKIAKDVLGAEIGKPAALELINIRNFEFHIPDPIEPTPCTC